MPRLRYTRAEFLWATWWGMATLFLAWNITEAALRYPNPLISAYLAVALLIVISMAYVAKSRR